MARPALISTMAIGGGRVEPVTMTPARFDLWYENFRSPLRAYLRRIANNLAAADDLFQETWIRFLTHPPNTLEAAAVRAYLFTIATHLARDDWRRESFMGRWFRAPRPGRGADPSRGESREIVGEKAQAPDALYAAREDVALALHSLTARERAIVWLAHVEQYEHREIAAMLGIRPGSVRVLLHRARQRALAALSAAETKQGETP